MTSGARTLRRAAALLCGAVLLATAPGCSGSDGDVVVAAAHANVALKDRLGAPITVGSTEPYSPRETCGACHAVDHIANGYHFQQGRTDASGAVVVEDDYFGKGTDYVRSAGMYGKW